jgi:phage major head subunit gpT-like protein
MLVSHRNLGLLFTGFKSTFARGWELADPQWADVAMEIPSSTEKEEYDWLGVFPGMREWIGDRVIQSLGNHGFTIRNKDWEQTLGVERNRIDDDRYGVYAPMFQRMGESGALHLDELVYGDLINNGRDATSLGYDDVPFFSAVHPHEDTGTWTNLDSGGAGPYWYLASLGMMKPLIVQMRKKVVFVSKASLTDDNVFFKKEFYFGADGRYNVGYGLPQMMFASNRTLNADNFWAAWEAIRAFTADNGKPLKVIPTHIIIPTSLEREATDLFVPDFSGGGNRNTLQGKVKIKISPHLAAA